MCVFLILLHPLTLLAACRVLCQEVLQESPGIAADDVLSNLVGFLEACKPRLLDLIQARQKAMNELDAHA
jgi:hypothetical protein